MKNVISIDWLCLHAQAREIPTTRGNYIFEIQKIKPREWGLFAKIYDKRISPKRHAFEFCALPSLSALPSETCLVKITNNLLYTANFVTIFADFLKEFNIVVKNISRLDICVDFQRFENCSVQHFFKSFFAGKYVKNGQPKFTTIGSARGGNFVFNYLRFGAATSTIQAYLYNKTKELKEVKDKAYIRALWRRAKFNTTKDVWRLEFSIKGKVEFCDKYGEVQAIDFTNLMQPNYRNNLISFLYNKYFDFRRITTDTNKSRAPRIELLNFDKTNIVQLVDTLAQANSGRSERIFIKKFYETINKLDEHAEVLQSLTNSFNYLAERLGLEYFVFTKLKRQY